MAALKTMIDGARYAGAQTARVAWYTGHYLAAKRLSGPLGRPGEAPYAARSNPVDRRTLYAALAQSFVNDWRNIAAGRYGLPREVTAPPRPAKALRDGRAFLRDARRVAKRRAEREYEDLPDTDETDAYPRYYLRNFHYQTDGWLSDESAALYDFQVETLFTGAAGAMRRMGLAAIAEAVAINDQRCMSLLDVGCGAGAFLGDVAAAFPAMSLTGIDLSPNYLARARRRLRRHRNAGFAQGAAEAIPVPDNSLDIVTAVYLFHELPPAARAAAAGEIARVLKPGGVFILLDTIQMGDAPALDILLEYFPREFHEPYYASYVKEDLEALFSEAGLALEDDAMAFLTKICVFRKSLGQVDAEPR